MGTREKGVKGWKSRGGREVSRGESLWTLKCGSHSTQNREGEGRQLLITEATWEV